MAGEFNNLIVLNVSVTVFRKINMYYKNLSHGNNNNNNKTPLSSFLLDEVVQFAEK